MPTAGIRVLTIAKRFDLPYNVTHIDKVANIMGTITLTQPDVIVTSTFQPGALHWAGRTRRGHSTKSALQACGRRSRSSTALSSPV